MDAPIKPESIRYLGPPVDEKGRIRKYQLPVGKARGLHELAAEFVFFTPAVLYLHARFTDAPLFDFMWELGREVPLYYHRFRLPVFAGLEARTNGDPGWNHALMAVRPDDWPALSAFLCGLAWVLTEEDMAFNFGEHDLAVGDPLAADLAGYYHRHLPATTVTAFGLTGSRFRAALVPSRNPLGRPTLRFFRPTAEMIAFHTTYKGGGNPVTARDLTRHRDRITKAKAEEGKPT